MTPEQFFEKETTDWRTAFEPRPTDGLLLATLKAVFGCCLIRLPYKVFVRERLKCKACWKEDYKDDNKARQLVWESTDLYMLLWAGFLIGLFVACVYLAGQTSTWKQIVVAVAVIAAILRLVEILAIQVELHTVPGYGTLAPGRAMLNTLCHYVVVAIAFAIFYLVLRRCTDDTFNSIIADPEKAIEAVEFGSGFTPLYFSIITLTTIGYGDFHPMRWPGQVLVVLEVVIGIALLVVVLQRAISRSLDIKKCDSETGNPSAP